MCTYPHIAYIHMYTYIWTLSIYIYITRMYVYTHTLLTVYILRKDIRSGMETKYIGYLWQRQQPDLSPSPHRAVGRAGRYLHAQWYVSRRGPLPQIKKLSDFIEGCW